MDTYHYAWLSEKTVNANHVNGMPTHSFKTVDDKWVQMTHKSQDTILTETPIYKPEGCWDSPSPNDLKFMGVLKMPLEMYI